MPLAAAELGIAGPALAAPRLAGPRSHALSTVVVPGGVLSFYRSGKFTAVCNNPFHGMCVLTRANTLRAAWRGRPLAGMLLWLEQGVRTESKEDHWASLAQVEDDRAGRLAMRAIVQEDADFLDILGHERPLAEGEAEET